MELPYNGEAMATPILQEVTPARGPTGGGTLVVVRGADFRLAAPTAASGAISGNTVEVLVGGQPAPDVEVVAADTLAFRAPPHDAGAADLTVRNLDDYGHLIPGEEATLPAGFTYVVPGLAVESELTRLVRSLLRELKRQVHPNVSLTVQTDFDADTGDELHLAELAVLPGLVLTGPELRENRFYSVNALPEVSSADGTNVRRRVPYTVDLGFTIVGVADHTTELLNLMAATTLFFHRNPYLEMDRDPAESAAGRVRYEMDFRPDGDLRVTSQPNESNVRSFAGAFVIRGLDLEDLAGLPGEGAVELTAPVDEVVIAPAEQLAPTLPVGRNPDP
jgi:hypothetical protein